MEAEVCLFDVKIILLIITQKKINENVVYFLMLTETDWFGKGSVCRERKPGNLSLARQPCFSCLAAFLLAPRLDLQSQWEKMIVLQGFACL